MNPQLQRLYDLAKKPDRRIVGLMSGTSLDGLDVALCRISGNGGNTQLSVEQFETVPYEEAFKDSIRAVFAKKQINFEHLTLLNEQIGRQHGRWVAQCLRNWHIEPADVDLVASHGQTVYHAPQQQHRRAGYPNATLQIGDGDHVAAESGIITLSDFRQRHIAHGGEGAPLAVYGDYLLFSQEGEDRILLNMGGIANFTYLPNSLDARVVFTTDTGPGNTLIDAFARQFTGQPYDENGQMAARGRVDEALLRALINHPFFAQPFPKTTGPEVFSKLYVQNAQQQSGTETIAPDDLMATLTRFSAETIAQAIQRTLTQTKIVHPHVYMSGGGAHNPVLVGAINALLPGCTFARTDALGIAGDAKEAVLFAVLANEAVAGTGKINFGERQGVPSVSMGKISFYK
ncbi:anhydro-N-acetylmuramic acid kinase [Fibrella sp. HMF5335]|uniref:Anhydro-N-acetylmuramic acid kinase n=1 Tax=Fibrella rubiginis TaxID=2817060 RepID=A0A939GJR3_9BACT|nr:anhydro-N-acetylmuramic acid kinase [Fibrella rubiginis]MBO0937728.1 anhydro-N-acetylmuramic acid kinase [Fibrella rubiginis]